MTPGSPPLPQKPCRHAYQDPDHPGNAIRPDVQCMGCGKLGSITYWGDWCFDCNVARMDRIGASLADIAKSYGIDAEHLRP